MTNYIIATIKPWNIELFKKKNPLLSGYWHLVTSPEELTLDYINKLAPKYIFFPHWSWFVPEEIIKENTCIAFHMTDLPYGRGGSPLQNLISLGHKDTKLSALKMTAKFDAGPIYLKKSLSLQGSAHEIFKRCAHLTFDMIEEIVINNPTPEVQQGQVIEFNRRTPKQSEIHGEEEIDKIYDLIRMLDADSYPRAFLEHGNYQLTFSEANIEQGSLTATVTFNKKIQNKSE